MAEYKCLNSVASFNDLSSVSWKGSSEPNVPSNVAAKSLAAVESQLLNDRLFCLPELGDEWLEWIGVGKFNVFVVSVDVPLTGTTYCCCWLPDGQYISRTEGRRYEGEIEGVIEGGGLGVTGKEVVVIGKWAPSDTVGWEFGKCVNWGVRVTGKEIFPVSSVFVGWELN
jgi:hypothetical protein